MYPKEPFSAQRGGFTQGIMEETGLKVHAGDLRACKWSGAALQRPWREAGKDVAHGRTGGRRRLCSPLVLDHKEQ